MAKTGRKTDYDQKRHPVLANALARNGYTEEQMAKFLGISNATFATWKKRHPEFLEALKTSKDEVDFQVENSLLKRALGFEYEETEITGGKDGKPVKVKKTKKVVAPDTTACIFWLKNRQKERWRDVQQREISGPGGGPVELVNEVAKEVANMTEEERRARINALIAKRGT